MTTERVRPIKKWAVGHASGDQRLIVVLLSCANQPDRAYAFPVEDAEELAAALLSEARGNKPLN